MLPARGRPAKPIVMSVRRHLTPGDIYRLATTDAAPRSAAPVLQRLSASHHAAARHLASGQSVRDTAILVGYTPQRVSDLTRDPAFQDLLSYYKAQITDESVEDAQRIHRKLLEASEVALDEIQDRLTDDAQRKELPMGELRQIAQMGLDRTVAPPKATTSMGGATGPMNITLNIGTKKVREKTIDEHGNPIMENEDG